MTTVAVPFFRAAVAALVSSALAALLFRRLRRTQYSSGCAFAISGCCALQTLLFQSAECLGASVLALSSYAIGASGVRLTKDQDPRRVIQFGTCLASAQIIAPLGGVIAAILLPLTLRIPQLRGAVSHAMGLYLLLLFIPSMMTLVLQVAADESTSAISRLLHPPADATTSKFTFESLCSPALAGLSLLPVVGFSLWKQPAGMTSTAVLLLVALCSAFALAAWFGENRRTGVLIAALLPLGGVAVGELSREDRLPVPMQVWAVCAFASSFALALGVESRSHA